MPYLLLVQSRDGLEIRTLYHEGRESRRWELAAGQERVYAAGSLAEERTFDGAGRLLAEKLFSSGQLSESLQYRYGLSGLSSVETRGPDGQLRSRERYELGLGGELRRVRRDSTGGEGAQELSLTSGGGRLYEERLSGGGRGLISRYDPEGRVATQETWQGRELQETLELAYSLQDPAAGRQPVAAVRTAAGTRTVTRFDPAGREISRQVSRGGKTVEEWSFRYDAGGNRSQVMRVDERGTRLWSYQYDAAGNLEREEERARGQLEKVVRYAEDGRVEELYRSGLLFFQVTYRGGLKVLEEFLEGGRVVRSRRFGEDP
jgi:YD repeat-containing protein